MCDVFPRSSFFPSCLWRWTHFPSALFSLYCWGTLQWPYILKNTKSSSKRSCHNASARLSTLTWNPICISAMIRSSVREDDSPKRCFLNSSLCLWTHFPNALFGWYLCGILQCPFSALNTTSSLNRCCHLLSQLLVCTKDFLVLGMLQNIRDPATMLGWHLSFDTKSLFTGEETPRKCEKNYFETQLTTNDNHLHVIWHFLIRLFFNGREKWMMGPVLLFECIVIFGR